MYMTIIIIMKDNLAFKKRLVDLGTSSVNDFISNPTNFDFF